MCWISFLFTAAWSSANLPDQEISPEMVLFYITQDTQRHPLLPELKSGCFLFSFSVSSLMGGEKKDTFSFLDNVVLLTNLLVTLNDFLNYW